jgi:TPP-dependent pyruvate/acetoin dehydrogenase alpha subunit
MKLPLVLVIEDNKFAYSTPLAKQMAIERVSDRALSYGVPSVMVDGNDMLAVYDAARTAVDRARAGGGPSVIGVDTMRMRGHAEHDDMRYVDRALLEEWTAKDPIPRFRRHLVEQAGVSEAQLEELDRTTKRYVLDEADLALAMPEADGATVGEGVFAPSAFPARLELVRPPF